MRPAGAPSRREAPGAGDPAPQAGAGDLRVAIVNDYEVIVAGLKAMLEPHLAAPLVELDPLRPPAEPVDVALFDTYGQPGPRAEQLRALAGLPAVGAVAAYSWTMSDLARAEAWRAGARGLIAKALPTATVVRALRAVAGGQVVDTGGFGRPAGGSWPGGGLGLTAREREVLARLAAGRTNRAIAESLGLTENTVRTHLKSIFRKLGVDNRSQAVARCVADAGFFATQGRPCPELQRGSEP